MKLGSEAKVTLEMEVEAPSGFNEADISVVHANTKQLKFTPGSTGFSNYAQSPVPFIA
jgi:hypothetical protein